MSDEKRGYRFEVHYLSPMAKRISDMMNDFDLDGKYGIQVDVLTFTSTSRLDPKTYKGPIRQAYEADGGKVLEITGGEIV